MRTRLLPALLGSLLASSLAAQDLAPEIPEGVPVPPGPARFAPGLLSGQDSAAGGGLLSAGVQRAPGFAPEGDPGEVGILVTGVSDPGRELPLTSTERDAQDPISLAFEVPELPAAGGSFTAVLWLACEVGYHVYAPGESEGIPVSVVPVASPGVSWQAPEFPSGTQHRLEILGSAIEYLGYQGRVRIPIQGRVEAGATPARLAVDVEYQACSETACLLPKERTLVAAPGERFDDGTPELAAEPAAHPAAEATPEGFGEAASHGLLWALLVAYLWGLAASLSPCVYPMIPVTIAFFGGQEEGAGRGRTFLLAFTYVLGIVLSYAVVGMMAARAGRDLGSLLVHPVVVTVVAGTLFAMGLSLFGAFEIRLPQALQSRLESGEGKGFLGAFLTGCVLGLVAAPCVGPFAASILLFVAKSGDPLTGFLALASFGFGMGTLFLFLAMGVSSLPRSGVWLITVKKIFGFVMIGCSLYFVQFVLPAWVLLPLGGSYLAVGGVMGGALDEARYSHQKAARGLMLVALVAGLYLMVAGLSERFPLAGTGGGRVEAGPAGALSWHHGLDPALEAGRSQGKPVFLDFYADWCIPCKQMEREVFSDPRVQQALSGFVVGKVDCTEAGMSGAVFKTREIGSLAMPYLGIFDPAAGGEAGGLRRELSHEGYLGPDEFLAMIQRAGAALGV